MPKVLCPVNNEALIDHALGRLRSVTSDLAVNVHVTQPLLRAHLADDGREAVTVSVEEGESLGTAGPLGALRDWIDGRPAVVVNGDTWCPGGLENLVEGWDGNRIRVLFTGAGDFGPWAKIAGALIPWSEIKSLEAEPSGLWEVSWRQAAAEGRLESVRHAGPFVDCADAADYLRANLLAAGGSVIAPDATVEGTVEDSVVWPGAAVAAREHLYRAIRTPKRTVLVRSVT